MPIIIFNQLAYIPYLSLQRKSTNGLEAITIPEISYVPHCLYFLTGYILQQPVRKLQIVDVD